MNLKSVTKLRIEKPGKIGTGKTSVTLRTGRKPGITGRNYEVVSDGKGQLELTVRDDVTVTFPEENSLEEAAILISKGDVSVTDLRGLKTLRVEGTYGDTDIRDVAVAKTIMLESMSGMTKISDTEAGRLVLSSMAGDLSVDADIGKIEAETISGSVHVKAGDEGSIALSTIAGAMKVETETAPDIEFTGQAGLYRGPESTEGSPLRIRCSSMNGTLDIETA